MKLRHFVILTFLLAALIWMIAVNVKQSRGQMPDPFRPGSPTNPYVVRQVAPDQYEVRQKIPSLDPFQNVMKPGGLANPWTINTRENGDVEINTKYNFGEGREDDE